MAQLGAPAHYQSCEVERRAADRSGESFAPRRSSNEHRDLSSSYEAALAPLLSRRSIKALVGPAPTDDEIDALLRAAVTVPDHGGLQPWRLVVVAEDARGAFGDALAAAARERKPDLADAIQQRVRAKAFAAPALIAVVARVNDTAKVPAWEQVVSAACAGYAITLAAHQLGLGAIWKSTPFVDGTALRVVLDMQPHDEFLGWINIGHVAQEHAPAGHDARRSIDLGPIVRRLDPGGAPRPY